MVRRPPRDDVTLLQGPHSRTRELMLLLRATTDFLRGFRILHFVGLCVTVFGSARFADGHPYYALAREMGGRLARVGFTVMTGGGPGLMEAANRGAREAGGRSVGCNIELPREQQPNAYMDRSVTCRHFFVRKVLLFKYSYAFVALPGFATDSPNQREGAGARSRTTSPRGDLPPTSNAARYGFCA